MSRASRRTRGRQLEARAAQAHPEPTYGATPEVEAIRVNPTERSLSVDVSKLEAPTQAYDADVAWVEHRPGTCSLLFAKFSRDEPGSLESRLEVRYPAEQILVLWKNSEPFFNSVVAYVNTWPEEARANDDPPVKTRAIKSHSEWATFSQMSHSGSAGAVDFYHLSTSALADSCRDTKRIFVHGRSSAFSFRPLRSQHAGANISDSRRRSENCSRRHTPTDTGPWRRRAP